MFNKHFIVWGVTSTTDDPEIRILLFFYYVYFFAGYAVVSRKITKGICVQLSVGRQICRLSYSRIFLLSIRYLKMKLLQSAITLQIEMLVLNITYTTAIVRLIIMIMII